MKKQERDNDPVNHPEHYNQHPSGVECIAVVEHFNFNLGNAIKYVWRGASKNKDLTTQIQDLRKARWYLKREIANLTGENAVYEPVKFKTVK